MHLKLLASPVGRALSLTVTAATGFLLSTLILRHGIKAWPDSWYDWQGSISMIEHGTYTTMLGVPIHDWPPLYSAYLAFFQIIFGQSGGTLMLATSVLAALNAIVWGTYTFKVFPADTGKAPIPILASLGFLALYPALYFISVLPNGLLLLFVGMILHLLAAIAEDGSDWGGVGKSALVGLLLAASVFTHNSAIVYIAASIIIIFLTAPTSLRQRIAAIVIILVISGVAWTLVPHGLTVKSHHATAIVTNTGAAAPSKVEQGTHFLFDPEYSLGQYLVQFPEGVGVFFLPLSSIAAQVLVGWAIFGAALYFVYRKPESKVDARQRLFLGFGLLGILGHFAIFNVVWLDTVYGDRFAWFFSMICVPIFFSRFRHHAVIIALMLVMVLGVSGWRVFKLVRTGIVAPLEATSGEVPLNSIHPQFFLTSRANPVVPSGKIAIEAPVYRWQTLADGQPAPHVHETVILLPSGKNTH
jgi:hypothetical protein